jgi:hypothetical protein
MEAIESDTGNRSDLVATVATVAVVGIGAAALEAALLPGLVLGVAANVCPAIFSTVCFISLHSLVLSILMVSPYFVTHRVFSGP